MNAGFGARLPAFLAVFFAGAFFAAAFLAGAFFAAFFAGAFFAAFFAGAFFVAFFADDFFAGDFFAADFLDDFYALAITVSVKGVFFSSTLGDVFSPVKIKMSVLCLVRNIKIYCDALEV